MTALLYLELRQVLNGLKYTLRSPKRLIPVLLIAAWIVSWILFGVVTVAVDSPASNPTARLLEQVPVDTLEAGIFLLLCMGSAAVLYGAFTSGMLVFSISHIDFLFPTPISRRQVLIVKLIKDYLKYAASVFFLLMLIGMSALGSIGLNVFHHGLVSVAAVTAFLIFVVNAAHLVNIVFTFGMRRLRALGVVIKSILAFALLSAIGIGVYQFAATGDSYAGFLWAADSPVMTVVFAPATWCARLLVVPLLLSATAEEYQHLAMLWLLAAASFVLLVARKENFYEPSLGPSVRHARRRQAVRSGDIARVRIEELREKGATRVGGLSIPAFGQGAVSLYWKDLVSRLRISRAQLVFAFVVPSLLIIVLRHFLTPQVLRNIPWLIPYAVFILAAAAQPMRSELKYANIIKPMPVAAWKAALAHALSNTTYLTLTGFILACVMYVFVSESRGQVLLLCALGTPFLGFAGVATSMIAALLYPDAQDSAQNYIYATVSLAMLSVAVIPTVVLSVLLMVLTDMPLSHLLIVIAFINLVVGGVAVSIAGSIFRRFEPTAD